MIIIDEVSFRHVEHEGFRDFVYSLRPEFPSPSRVIVSKDCFKLVRVCLTTDIWASRHHFDYMCLTTHFIDDNWKLQKRILKFSCIPSHTGATIGLTIETNLIDWGIEKVLTITVDNASSNDVGMQYLKKRFINWKENVLNGEFLHMRCCAHILSLIVKDGMKEVDDSIYHKRSAVRFVRSSTSRLQRFKACVHKEKLDSFVCLDVEIRWNSTYLMLQSAVVFQRAFERLEEKDVVFRSELQKSKGTPLDTDWIYVKSLLPFLKSFYDATLRVSSLYVTCNECFHLVFGIGAMLNDLVNSTNESTKFMDQRMKLKNDKYWGNMENMNYLLFIAVVHDHRYKLQYVKLGLELVYEKQKVQEFLTRVNVSLDALFNYYLVIGGNGGIETSRNGESALLDDEIESDKSIEEYLKGRYKRQKLVEEAEELSKSELDRYLEAKCVNQDEENFDILAWWKRNSSDYPILGLMAKDILAVQVSIVASESAFSTGGRVLDAFRSSLTPKVVESLICAQNWLRSSTQPLDIEEKFEEIEALEEGTIYSIHVYFFN
ncbi:Putative AC transposase [Linum perenne]